MTTSSRQERVQALDEKLAQHGLRGYWQVPASPPKEEKPQLTRWSDLYPLLLEAGEVVELGAQAERRNLGGYQIVLPGETALAHRHTQSAMRFVVAGNGTAYTTTNGEQMFMEPGDLMVQPSWGWHDHSNPGKEPVIWMDILDLDMAGLLGPRLRDYWTEGEAQPITHTQGHYGRLYGLVRPARLIGGSSTPTPMAYKWRDTYQALQEMAAAGERDPYDGVLLEYRNPATGGPTVPTLSARIQLLAPGEATRAHRHMGKNRYHVVKGEGVATLDTTTTPLRLEWAQNDTFTIPSWRWHELRNTSSTEPAILFSVTDAPSYQAFGFYREEGQ